MVSVFYTVIPEREVCCRPAEMLADPDHPLPAPGEVGLHSGQAEVTNVDPQPDHLQCSAVVG